MTEPKQYPTFQHVECHTQCQCWKLTDQVQSLTRELIDLSEENVRLVDESKTRKLVEKPTPKEEPKKDGTVSSPNPVPAGTQATDGANGSAQTASSEPAGVPKPGA